MLSERLKEETHRAHISVEHLIIPKIKNLDSKTGYASLLHIFFGYFKPVEEKIALHINDNIVKDINERRKAAAILEDIKFVEGNEEMNVCEDLPTINNVTDALGAMYVLEGSTLGGKFLSKMISDKLSLNDTKGVCFFNGYGSSSNEKWDFFKNVLNKYTSDATVENEVIDAANQTFTKFKDWIETH